MTQSYSHPVLTPYGNAITQPLPRDNSELKVQQIRSEDFIVTLDLKLNDEYILSLITAEKAKYFVVIECDDTRYREKYIIESTTDTPHFKIAIPRKSVVDNVGDLVPPVAVIWYR